MPSFNAINAAKLAAIPSQKINPGQIKGDVLFAYDEFTSPTALAAADIIVTGIVIPAGAKVRSIITVNPTNGGTMSVGTVLNPTKYINAMASGASLTTIILADIVVDEQLIVTMGVATAVGTYKVSVDFIKD